MEKLLSEDSIALIGYMLNNETIRNKVYSAGEEGETYTAIRVSDSGIVTLGKTKVWWWNRLLKCQFPLTFHQFASAVWDALLDLSAGGNQKALEEGLGKEIMKRAQREKDYNWVVKRLQECYDHVCNNKGGAPIEVGREKSGPSVANAIRTQDNPVTVNVNIDGKTHRKVRIPDATGQAFLTCELGVTDVHVEVD